VKNNDWVVPFKIILPPIIRFQWYELATKLNLVRLNENNDRPIWRWTTNKQFTLKSVYLELTKMENGPSFKVTWKSKIPGKIKIFVWLVAEGAILTKDNMLRRNWHEDPGCYVHGESESETVDHLLFTCHIAKLFVSVGGGGGVDLLPPQR
jgi:hypothetical protein